MDAKDHGISNKDGEALNSGESFYGDINLTLGENVTEGTQNGIYAVPYVQIGESPDGTKAGNPFQYEGALAGEGIVDGTVYYNGEPVSHDAE